MVGPSETAVEYMIASLNSGTLFALYLYATYLLVDLGGNHARVSNTHADSPGRVGSQRGLRPGERVRRSSRLKTCPQWMPSGLSGKEVLSAPDEIPQ
ncbi:hypothetical protein C9J85_02310 [Haloferax sp. wsp5]|nr:hypothetical protein C9J85_02310 [Haloferax sp. wsp5]